MPDSFTETFAAGSAGYGNRPCLEFEERWFTGNEVTGYADAIAGKLHEAGVSEYAPVGVVVGNRLPHAAAIVGLLAARRVPLSRDPASSGRSMRGRILPAPRPKRGAETPARKAAFKTATSSSPRTLAGPPRFACPVRKPLSSG